MMFLILRLIPLSLLCLVSTILIATLITMTCITITNKLPHFVLQRDQSNLAKALSKYPEVGLPSPNGPAIVDPNLKAQVITRGLRYPTSMAFLGPNDILVTEKNAGTVRRIVNGTELQQPLLNASVATYGHRGMLDIAIAHHPLLFIHHRNPNSHHNKATTTNTTGYVFLYYTQAQTHTGDDITEGKQPLGNRLYRYELIGNKLINPKLLLDLPAIPGAIGNGGKVVIGPDNNVYVTIGDVGINGHRTKAQNIRMEVSLMEQVEY
jgi:glucose/arabinose dehydrogenase